MDVMIASVCAVAIIVVVGAICLILRNRKQEEDPGRIVTEDQIIEKMNTILRYNNEDRL